MVSGLSTDRFAFFGFPPARGKDRKLWFQQVVKVGGTIVFFEAPHRIGSTLKELAVVAGDCHIVIGRELTKVHEELVRGPISNVLPHVQNARGELTVVAEIGHKTDNDPDVFGLTPETVPTSRREAVVSLAKVLGLAPNELYAALEQHRNR